ncbi:DUF2291 family protein [[Erwinia] mediterraneensis]|uniref:DUF2291 family protein n=1 Tax=[Erwinia] mediterraneensis TaxID=2161819 RepID=UPI001031D9BA|nr:DUF2291 family protein [[Erwinia] mediterraneensis]
MKTTQTGGAVITVMAALLLAACTVVDLDAEGKPVMPQDPNAKASFSSQTPQQIAESSWQSKVIDAARQQGLSWADMKTKSATVPADSNESVFVQASGKVTAFDEGNGRERSLTMTINGEPVKVLVGPLLRGNAIRDAAGFRFEQFTNQVQYAQLTRALNRHAVKQLPPLDASWVNQQVQALLAVTMGHNSVESVVAVSLTREDP